MNFPFDKIYFLVYTEDAQRVSNVNDQIQKLGLTSNQYIINNTVSFPYSYDCGKYLLNTDYERLGWIIFRNSFAGVFNCVMEHYKMIRSAYNLGYEKILICEDDINFIDNNKYIEDTFNQLPDKFGIVKFFYTDYRRTSKGFGLRKITGYLDGIKSTACYAIDRDGMEAYMKSFEKFFRPADDVFEGCYDVLQVYTGPLICYPQNFKSNIEI